MHSKRGAMLALVWVVSCSSGATPSAASSAVPPQVDTVQAQNDSIARAVLARIGPRQSQPAESVFTNLQIPWLKPVPARTLVGIMNGGYAKALGVTCSHCHVTTDFASDAKRPKLAAREMAVMHRMINQELGKMEHIATPKTSNRAINCMTCHRGAVDPRAR